MRRTRGLRLLLLASVLAGAIAAPGLAAEALLSKGNAKARIEKDLGVEVLRLREVDVEGRPAFAATIMNPGGNYNAAFQVNTVVLDRKTGTLIHRFGQNGQELESGTIHSTREDSGPVIRRQTFEDPRR